MWGWIWKKMWLFYETKENKGSDKQRFSFPAITDGGSCCTEIWISLNTCWSFWVEWKRTTMLRGGEFFTLGIRKKKSKTHLFLMEHVWSLEFDFTASSVHKKTKKLPLLSVTGWDTCQLIIHKTRKQCESEVFSFHPILDWPAHLTLQFLSTLTMLARHRTGTTNNQSELLLQW